MLIHQLTSSEILVTKVNDTQRCRRCDLQDILFGTDRFIRSVCILLQALHFGHSGGVVGDVSKVCCLSGRQECLLNSLTLQFLHSAFAMFCEKVVVVLFEFGEEGVIVGGEFVIGNGVGVHFVTDCKWSNEGDLVNLKFQRCR